MAVHAKQVVCGLLLFRLQVQTAGIGADGVFPGRFPSGAVPVLEYCLGR
jgi:hypothetical protein